MTDNYLQAAMAVPALTALGMALSGNRRLIRWAPAIGLPAQIPWLIYAHQSGAWAITLIAVAYAGVYLWAGVRQVWWRAER